MKAHHVPISPISHLFQVSRRPGFGFTLIELLTAISVIAILLSLLMAAVGRSRESAKQTAAKTDLVSMVAAVNAFYTDYGIYPIPPPVSGTGTQVTYTTDNSDLFYTLRAVSQGDNTGNALNTKETIYLDVPNVANPLLPRSGIYQAIWYEPWGRRPASPRPASTMCG